MNYLFCLAIGIGIVAGFRAMTAPAAVSWAAHLGWLHLAGTPLSFMGSTIAVAVFTLGAVGELINDQLPKTPPRTVPPQFIVRDVMAGFCGACLYLSAGSSIVIGALLGAVGAVIGTLGGYHARRGMVSALGVKDILVAIPEDLIAIGLAYFIVR